MMAGFGLPPKQRIRRQWCYPAAGAAFRAGRFFFRAVCVLHPHGMAPSPARVRIGISGWRYPRWRGVFYPKGLPQRRELEYAGSQFPTVEINGTFYSLQRPESFACWHDATPDDFVFAVKGPYFVTHHLRLANAERALGNFFASGLLALGTKLGPFLWQLPPNFRYDEERIDAFLAQLPRDTDAAAHLARRRDPVRMKGRSRLV